MSEALDGVGPADLLARAKERRAIDDFATAERLEAEAERWANGGIRLTGLTANGRRIATGMAKQAGISQEEAETLYLANRPRARMVTWTSESGSDFYCCG